MSAVARVRGVALAGLFLTVAAALEPQPKLLGVRFRAAKVASASMSCTSIPLYGASSQLAAKRESLC